MHFHLDTESRFKYPCICMHRHVYTLTCDMKATRVQFMGDRGGRAAGEDRTGRAQLFCVVSSAEGETVAGSEGWTQSLTSWKQQRKCIAIRSEG